MGWSRAVELLPRETDCHHQTSQFDFVCSAHQVTENWFVDTKGAYSFYIDKCFGLAAY